MMHHALVPRVTSAFGLKALDVDPAQKGYRNESYRLVLASGEIVNLIFHKNERDALLRIQSANIASSALSERFPVRTRFDERILRLSDDKRQVYAGVYTYLPGTTIPWEAYTKDHIKLLGWAMSDMHAAWRSSSGTLGVRIDDELRLLSERMGRYFASQDVQQAVRRKLRLRLQPSFAAYDRLFSALEAVPQADEHILHMDMVRGNVLFNEGGESPWLLKNLALTGVIDFEKAALGHPVYDIARTLAFLLVDCATKSRASIYKYFLQSGYNKRGASSFRYGDTIADLSASEVLRVLVSFFLLHDFYKFLRHTPYESLEENHHFVRTRDILIDYGMIRLDKD